MVLDQLEIPGEGREGGREGGREEGKKERTKGRKEGRKEERKSIDLNLTPYTKINPK